MSTRVLMLDGDRLRAGLCRGLGFTDVDRDENLRRAAEVARLGVESGLIVIAAFITPHEKHREFIRHIVGESHLSLVHLAATLEVCRTRDAKGLYARADAGDVALMTGIDSRFDEPSHVDLQIDTSLSGVDVCVESLTDFVQQRLRRER
jgi:adenylyl-sulfate kinase